MQRTESTCFALLTFFLSSPWVSVRTFFFNFVFYLSSSFLDKKPGSSCADTNSLKCHPSFCLTLEWAVPNPLRTLGGWAKRRMTFQTKAQKPQGLLFTRRTVIAALFVSKATPRGSWKWIVIYWYVSVPLFGPV